MSNTSYVSKQRLRRPYQSGSITPTGPGKWLVRIPAGRNPQTGRPTQAARRVQGTRAVAEAALAELRRSSAGHKSKTLEPKVTLNELIERYFERGSKLSGGARRSYQSLWRRWIVNGVGRVRAADVSAYDYSELWTAMSAAGLSRSTMNSAFSLIKGAYRAAARYDEFEYNVARFEPPERPEPFVREHLSDEQLRAVLQVAAAAGGYWPLFVRLALALGARRGEVVALRWSALEGDLLSIRNSVDFDRKQMVLSNTKNDQPRTIALDAESIEMWLCCRSGAAELYQRTFGGDMPDDGFVFADGPTLVRPIRPDGVSKAWRLMCSSETLASVELRELRNWHATTLDVDFDYSMEAIGRRLGHSQGRAATRVTQRYVTTFRERDRRMAADIGSRLHDLYAGVPAVEPRDAGTAGVPLASGREGAVE